MLSLKLRFERIFAINSKHSFFVLVFIISNLYLMDTQITNASPGDLEIKEKLNSPNAEYVVPTPTLEDLVKIQNSRFSDKPDKVYVVDKDVELVSEFIWEKMNLRKCRRHRDIKWEVYVNWWRKNVYKPDPLRYLIPDEPIRQPKYQNVDIRYVM